MTSFNRRQFVQLSRDAVIIVLTAWSLLFAQSIVVPIEDSIGIYHAQIHLPDGEPLGKVGTADSLITLKSDGCYLLVEREDGLIGWIKVFQVAATGKRKSLKCKKPVVLGYMDGPTPIYFFDEDSSATPINLDRSFKEALRENSDSEAVEDCSE